MTQLDLSGRDARAPYDRDADAQAVRLFEPVAAQLPGQTSLIDDGAMTNGGTNPPGRTER